MKTIRNIILGIIFTLALVSCDNPVALGSKLDLQGPIVNFTAPFPRKAVTASFLLEGTATDKSGVDIFIIKVERNREELPRQWRYSKGVWEISDDSGVSWRLFPEASWDGDKSVVWSVPVDLTINGAQPEDGEYMFSAVAWDKGGISDDNSFKTIILIIDNDPPKVSVNRPLLYDRYLTYTGGHFDTTNPDGQELETLLGLDSWKYPEHINKFQTGSFPLQWAIEDNFNIWSFDLRFYEMSVPIDGDINTPLPDDYIYSFRQNTPPVPDNPSPNDYVKPNGTVIIPSLSESIASYPGRGEVKKLITDRTVIRVVAVCYDAANNAAQEKTLGYFVYWPQADIPWITFSGDIKTPEYYNTGNTFISNVEKAFMIYPGVEIKAIAFHAQGIENVVYSISKLDEPIKNPTFADNTLTPLVTNVEIKNEQSSRGKFDWEFKPEPRSAYYVVTAVTKSTSGKLSDPVSALFKVQDITFPDFPVPLSPPELDPLFKHINSNSITISGIVSDVTNIETLCLVWINPQSAGFASQSQLEYFKDANYGGWTKALTLTAGGAYAIEDIYSSTAPNKVWKLITSKSTDYTNGINPATQRVEYKFSKTIPLSDLNIGGVGGQPLKSQVFLLRAANAREIDKPKTTIITYTPQGDEGVPEIKITSATVNGVVYPPGSFEQIEKLKENDTITIDGTWYEDSMEYLNFNTYLRDNFVVKIGSTILTTKTFSDQIGPNGKWRAIATVKDTTSAANQVPTATLKDTLVVSAELTDIGGNKADDQASWLIQSDLLRIVRISSEMADQTYSSGSIDIFIEFNKPVSLKSGRSVDPSLTLRVGSNTTITAAYKNGQNIQSTRQYFTYSISSEHNTTTAYPYIDVIGLNGLAGGNYWENAAYPFTWEAISATSSEEIRVTMNTAHTSDTNPTYQGAYLRRLPVAANSADEKYSLAKGKNIGIDTTAPAVQSIYSSNKEGHYALDSEIIINVVFNEPVKISSTAPQLNLQVYKWNGTSVTSTSVTTAGNVKVNDRTVTFSYTVAANDTTGDNKVIVTGFTNTALITDIAGNAMAAMTLTATQRTLNGGSANNGAGIFINTIPPGVPTFRALTANNNNNASIIPNTINNATVTGESITTGDIDLKNYYGDDLWFAINGNTNTINTGISATGNERLGALEYSLDALSVDPPVNWKRIDSTTGTPFQQSIYGKYAVRVRQIDKAGNASAASKAVSLNWDPGTLVSRIDSSSANGTYTNNSSRTDTINVTVYFRKPLTITGTPQITLNVIRGTTTGITVSGSTASNVNSLSFTYNVANNDNTPALTGRDQYLDVTALNITARDAAAAADGVVVTNFIKPPDVNDNKLKYRKDILVQTGALTLSSGPTYNFTTANDVATGTITLTFNRNIVKNTTTPVPAVTVTQQDTGYRLPAVLTESQATKYQDVVGFGTYYKKGTNGFSGSAPDTSTKYVLDYTQTTVVTPANTSGMAKFAYDFRAAESVSLPMTSQDITVNTSNERQLVITVTGSNALQVLGATYNFAVPVGIVQDSLGFQWPTTAQNYTGTNGITTTGINRPFVRVDKKINEDRITSETGSRAMPHLRANFDRLVQTRARLDCRTPNSIVRYNTAGQTHNATGATTDYNRTGSNWRNGAALNINPLNEADRFDYLSQPALQETGNTGTNYTDFDSHIIVGTAATNPGTATENIDGYIWRISVRSRNGTNGNTNSPIYEEIAFRTVLTYQLNGIRGHTSQTAPNNNSGIGQNLNSGDQLWIRGGDAISSSSVPGFPLTWSDDYTAVRNESRRAGVRLLRMISSDAVGTNTSFNTNSVWRWVTWEINVRTWHDVVLARGKNTDTAYNAVGAAQGVNDAWQFGPYRWAYQRGGWAALKDDYTLYPGKHRWVTITNYNDYQPGSAVNFSLEWNTRIEPTPTTVTMPPAP